MAVGFGIANTARSVVFFLVSLKIRFISLYMCAHIYKPQCAPGIRPVQDRPRSALRQDEVWQEGRVRFRWPAELGFYFFLSRYTRTESNWGKRDD